MTEFKNTLSQLERTTWDRFYKAVQETSHWEYDESVRVFEATLTLGEKLALDNVRRKLVTFFSE